MMRAQAVRDGEPLARFGLTLALETGRGRTLLAWTERWRAVVGGTGQPVAPDLNELRAALGDGVLVEFVRHGDELVAVAVTPDRVMLRRLGPFTAVTEATVRLRYGLRRTHLLDGRVPEPAAEAAALERLLFGPLRGPLRERRGGRSGDRRGIRRDDPARRPAWEPARRSAGWPGWRPAGRPAAGDRADGNAAHPALAPPADERRPSGDRGRQCRDLAGRVPDTGLTQPGDHGGGRSRAAVRGGRGTHGRQVPPGDGAGGGAACGGDGGAGPGRRRAPGHPRDVLPSQPAAVQHPSRRRPADGL